ncbi:hypothetical protein ACKWTF_001279 [Chironomus riparius]
MWIKHLIMLYTISLSFSASNIFTIDQDKYLGDSCGLWNGLNGTCVKAKECKTIRKGNSITRCEFDFNTLIVCCPNIEENQSETTIISTFRKTTEFQDNIRANNEETTYPEFLNLHNPRFDEMLCKNVKTELKFVQNIVGGSMVEVAEFPYQVILGYLKDNKIEFNCGGSLIANNLVLTAAHCVNKLQPEVVRLGRTSLVDNEDDDGPVVDVGIKKIIFHKDYNLIRKMHDIALIQLNNPVEYSYFIKPICLSQNDDIWSKNLTVSGYGIMNADKNIKSNWLMKATVQEYDFDDCRKEYEELNKTIVKSQMCALGLNGADACSGDSGGPLIYEEDSQDRLIGITSYSIGCGSEFSAVYTRIGEFLKWIELNVNKLEQDSNS